MRRLYVVMFCCLCLGQVWAQTHAVLTGTIQDSGQVPVTGRLQVKILMPGIRDTCNNNHVVPTLAVYIPVVNGVVNGGSIQLSAQSCFSNPAALYQVKLLDKNGNELFQDKWYLAATGILDVGTLFRKTLPLGGGTYGIIGNGCGYGVTGYGIGGYGASC